MVFESPNFHSKELLESNCELHISEVFMYMLIVNNNNNNNDNRKSPGLYGCGCSEQLF